MHGEHDYDFTDFDQLHDEIAGGPEDASKVIVRLPDGTEDLKIRDILFEEVDGGEVACILVLDQAEKEGGS